LIQALLVAAGVLVGTAALERWEETHHQELQVLAEVWRQLLEILMLAVKV
jgi:hypothetical protein